MAEKKVKGNDTVTVYATKVLEDAKLYKTGDEIQVHSVQAEKLIASGKATKTPPAKK